MINLTVEEALAFVPTLKQLMGEKLPIKVAYKIARFARLAEEQLVDFNKQRVSLINEMGVKEADGTVTIPDAKMNDFMGKLKEILPEGLTIQSDQIALADFGDAVQLTPYQLVALEQYRLLKA